MLLITRLMINMQLIINMLNVFLNEKLIEKIYLRKKHALSSESLSSL